MARAPQGKDAVRAPEEALSGHIAAGIRPSEAQRRYLERGLTQAGGKLPLFDLQGREVARKTVESCVAHGWATPWVHNPIKPDWARANNQYVSLDRITHKRRVFVEDGAAF